MTDVELAKANLNGHTICLCKEGKFIFSELKGIAPMLGFIESLNLSGYSAADLVVGKAAAMLFVKAGIKEVYANTLSVGGKAVLEQYGIPFSYGVLTEKIINRKGTDVCPMEKSVMNAQSIEEGYNLILKTYENLNK